MAPGWATPRKKRFGIESHILDQPPAIPRRDPANHRLFLIAAATAVLTMSLLSGCQTASIFISQQTVEGVTDKDGAIAQSLAGGDIDYNEGIRVTGNQNYQVAIVKNTFDHLPDSDDVAIITKAKKMSWNPGQIKMAPDKTADRDLFTGNHRDWAHMAFEQAFDIRLGTILQHHWKNEFIQWLKLYPTGNEAGTSAGTGTGFFVGDGLVATNHHVIKDAKQIKVVRLSPVTACDKAPSTTDLTPRQIRKRAGEGVVLIRTFNCPHRPASPKRRGTHRRENGFTDFRGVDSVGPIGVTPWSLCFSA